MAVLLPTPTAAATRYSNVDWDALIGSAVDMHRRPIQSLNIHYCAKITDAGVKAVASGCPRLQSLVISGCDKITDAGIIALATGCPRLQSLDISACDKITDAGREIVRQINDKITV